MKLIAFSDEEVGLLQAILEAEQDSVAGFWEQQDADLFYSIWSKVDGTNDPTRP